MFKRLCKYCNILFNPTSRFNKICPICVDKNLKIGKLKTRITLERKKANKVLTKQKNNDLAI